MTALLAYLPAINAAVMLGVLVARRRTIVATVARMPLWMKVLAGLLLTAGALIPGPVDDVLIGALIVRMGASR